MSERQIWLIRTPLRQTNGLTWGGPMRIKIGRRRLAYAGFISPALAKVACNYWNVHAEHWIEPWQEAIRHDTDDARPQRVLLFQDEADFLAWLQHPEQFDLEAHTLSLHFGMLKCAGR